MARKRKADLAARFPDRIEIGGYMVAPVPDERHGSASTYNNHGCRCPRCSRANTLTRWPDTPEWVELTATEHAQLRLAQARLVAAQTAGNADRDSAISAAKKARSALVLELDRKYGHGYGMVRHLAEALGLSRYTVDRILKGRA